MNRGETGPDAARLYRWHVPRSRLTRVIEESSARVVLLVAPAGYGKTTMVVLAQRRLRV
jgi:ATP/maltotriose-dependent transcriptional regulator MalT